MSIVTTLKEKVKGGLIRNSLTYIVGAFFLKGMAFLLIPLYTNYFSPAQYGQIEFLNTMNMMFTILFSFGTSQLLYTDYYHLDTNLRSDMTRGINNLYLKAALPAALIIGLVWCWRNPDHQNTAAIALSLVSAWLMLFLNNYYIVLQLDKQAKRVTTNKAVYGIISLLTSVVLIKYFGWGISTVFFAAIVASIITLLLFIGRDVRAAMTEFRIADGFSKEWTLIKRGWPFIVTSGSYFAMNGADRLLIKIFLNGDSLGFYSLAFKFASVYEPLLITPFLAAYSPHVFDSISNGGYRFPIKKITSITLCIFLMLAVITVFAAKLVIAAAFYPALHLIPYFVIGFAFALLAQAAAVPLLYYNKRNLLVLNVFIAGIVNILSLLVLMKYFNADGAAIAYMISSAIWFGVTAYQTKMFMDSIR